MHRWVVAAFIFVSLVAWGGVVRADVIDDCRSARSAEIQLSACSEIIASAAYSPTDKAMAFRNRGRARSDAGALDLALADLSEAIWLNPSEGPLYITRGLVRVRLNDLVGAIADYSEAIRLSPKSAIGYNGRGHAHLVRGNEKNAIADFSEAIALNAAVTERVPTRRRLSFVLTSVTQSRHCESRSRVASPRATTRCRSLLYLMRRSTGSLPTSIA